MTEQRRLATTDVATAVVVAERLHDQPSATPIAVPGDRPVWITASIGAAPIGRDPSTARQRLQNADDAR